MREWPTTARGTRIRIISSSNRVRWCFSRISMGPSTLFWALSTIITKRLMNITFMSRRFRGRQSRPRPSGLNTMSLLGRTPGFPHKSSANDTGTKSAIPMNGAPRRAYRSLPRVRAPHSAGIRSAKRAATNLPRIGPISPGMTRLQSVCGMIVPRTGFFDTTTRPVRFKRPKRSLRTLAGRSMTP